MVQNAKHISANVRSNWKSSQFHFYFLPSTTIAWKIGTVHEWIGIGFGDTGGSWAFNVISFPNIFSIWLRFCILLFDIIYWFSCEISNSKTIFLELVQLKFFADMQSMFQKKFSYSCVNKFTSKVFYIITFSFTSKFSLEKYSISCRKYNTIIYYNKWFLI